MRALVVEDELKMAALLRRGLTEEGYAADIARTGDEALWMTRAAPYDVIVLARADGGELPVRREPVAAADLIEGIADRFRARADDAGRAIETRVEDGLVLDVDRLRAEQAVGNLVDNALRHGRGPDPRRGAARRRRHGGAPRPR